MDNEENGIKEAKKNGLLTSGNKIIACPHCGSASVIKHGTKDGKQRYRCKDCKKTFVETTNKVSHHSRLSEWQWKEIIKGMILNLSIGQISDITGLSTKAVWYNKNKVLQLVSNRFGEQDTFKDIAECDETEVHLSYKGKRDPRFFIYHLRRMPRANRSREEKIEYLQKYGLLEELQHDPEQLEAILKGDRYLPGTKNDSVCVLTGIDRGKNLVIKPVCLGKLESGHVCQEFDTRFGNDAMIVTDGNSSYNWFAEERNIHHEVIPADKHAVGPYSLARVNAIHADYNKYYPQHKQNLPATKYLDLGTDFFWWLEKNKDNSIEEKVDMLYKMVQEDNYTESYEDMRHRKLKLDTKGLIPTEL